MSIASRVTQPSAFQSWSVVLAGSLLFFYIFIQMNLFSAINAEMMGEFGIGAQQISQLYAFFTYGNVLLLFPAGMLLDRFSVRNLMLGMFLLAVASTYLFAVSSNLSIIGLARFATGVSGAFSFIAAVKLASRWFAPKRMALVVGVIVMVATLGGLFAQTPLAICTQKLGWRGSLQLVTWLGLALWLIQLLVVRDEPKGAEKLEIQEHDTLHQLGFWRSLGSVLANRQNWLAGSYISLINLPVFVLGGIWGTPYLIQVHQFDKFNATLITGMIFIGMMVGSPLAGLISDRLGSRKNPMIIGALLTIGVVLVIMLAPTLPLAVEIALFFALGLVASSQVIGYPVIAESNPSAITATATSLGSILIVGAGALMPLYGWLLDLNSGEGGAMIHTTADFFRANSLMLIGLGIALGAALIVKESCSARGRS